MHRRLLELGIYDTEGLYNTQAKANAENLEQRHRGTPLVRATRL